MTVERLELLTNSQWLSLLRTWPCVICHTGAFYPCRLERVICVACELNVVSYANKTSFILTKIEWAALHKYARPWFKEATGSKMRLINPQDAKRGYYCDVLNVPGRSYEDATDRLALRVASLLVLRLIEHKVLPPV